MRRSEYIEVTLDADRPGDGNSELSAKTVSEYGGVARRCVGSEEGRRWDGQMVWVLKECSLSPGVSEGSVMRWLPALPQPRM